MTTFKVHPFPSALGAEIIDLDLSRPISGETFEKVHRLHLDQLVLVFRDQRLTPQQQVKFSKLFGPLDQHPADDAVLADYPEVLVLSTKRKDGKYVGLPDAGPMWHSDLAYKKRTALGTMLYGIEIPDSGGDTGFANMYKAYEALPRSLVRGIEGKRGIFIAGRNNPKRAFRKALSQAQKDKTPAVTHPIIRTHPETGRRSIFASPQHTIAIEGMSEKESGKILSDLFEHSTQPEFVYRHKWRVGDVTFWDNRCVLHVADHSRLDDPTYIRHLHRTTIQGDVPFWQADSA